jgi:hypothetical protein
MKFWVARDENKDLFAYESKPHRGKEEWFGGGKDEYLGAAINGKCFKDLTWESEPFEVELKTVGDVFKTQLTKQTNFLEYLNKLENQTMDSSMEFIWSGLLSATCLAKIAIIREIKGKYIEIAEAQNE